MKTSLGFSFKRLCQVAKKRGHGDGWGVAWLEDGDIRLQKDKEPIWDSEAKELMEEVASKLIIVHARKRSLDAPSAAKVNSHPFVQKALGRKWTFAHNGSVVCPKPKHRLTSEGVDSEQFFCYLLDAIDKIGGEEPDIVLDALRYIWKDIKVKSSLNFVLASKNYLYAFRHYVKRESYYTLYRLKRTWRDAIGREIKKRKGEIALIVCSEKLTGRPLYSLEKERWKMMENGEMLMIRIGRPLEVYPKLLDFTLCARSNLISKNLQATL